MKDKTRLYAGLAAVISGVLLIGSTGFALALGWALWAVGVGLLMVGVPTASEDRGRREAAPSSYSLVR